MNDTLREQTEADRRFGLLCLSDIERLPDLFWLAQSILPKPCLAVLYGEPGSGKSFVALDLGLTVTRGGVWLGKATAPAKALYIAAEGALGLKLRIQAYKTRHGVESQNIAFLPMAINLLDEAGIAGLIAELQRVHFVPDLLIIDTLARVTVGADENNAKDMGKAVAALDRLKNAAGSAVLVIHHTRKGGDSERGSSALRGAADVMILCEASECLTGPAVRLTCTKMKDAEPFSPLNISLDRVPLGGGKSSLVLGQPYDGLGFSNEKAGQILETLNTKFSETGATNGELLKAFIAAGHGQKSTFDRGLRDLKKNGKLRVERSSKGPRYFPTSVSVNQVSNQCQTQNSD